MKNFGRVRGSVYPSELTITDSSVMVASNIIPYSETIDSVTTRGYEYDYVQYSKNEYIQLLAQKTAVIASLEDELAATKILLGVD